LNSRTTAFLLAIVALVGCATATLGDKNSERELKQFGPIPGKVSLYICREDTFNGGGVGTEAFVDGSSLGGLKTNTFAHTVTEPGDISIFLRRKGVNQNSGDSGVLKVTGKPGEVVIVWAGPAGFMGPLTVDRFTAETDARNCVQKASYAVK
jgi:hypothetical protein